MTFKLSKSLGFEQRCRQERKAGSYLKARMHHMNFQENQMEFSFPVNRNILFSNPILKWILQNVSHIEREPGPNPSVLAPLQKIPVKIQTQTCKLCLNGQLFLQHQQALGSLKQTDFWFRQGCCHVELSISDFYCSTYLTFSFAQENLPELHFHAPPNTTAWEQIKK